MLPSSLVALDNPHLMGGEGQIGAAANLYKY